SAAGPRRRSRRSADSTASCPRSRSMLIQSAGATSSTTTNTKNASKPPSTPGRLRAMTLSIGRARDLAELGRIAEDAIDGAVDRSGFLQRPERLVDLRPAGAEQQRDLALRHAELDRDALAGRRPAVAD